MHCRTPYLISYNRKYSLLSVDINNINCSNVRRKIAQSLVLLLHISFYQLHMYINRILFFSPLHSIFQSLQVLSTLLAVSVDVCFHILKEHAYVAAS